MVQKLWKALKKWLYNIIKKKVEISDQEIIFNEFKGTEKSVVNTLIIILKRYIYVTKCKAEQLNFTCYISLVRFVYEIERINALKNEKIVIHEKKWSKIKNFVT